MVLQERKALLEIILEIGCACFRGNKKLVRGKTEPSQEKSLLASISLFVFAANTRPLRTMKQKYDIKSKNNTDRQTDQKQTNDEQLSGKVMIRFFAVVGVM